MPYIGRELERGTYLKLDDISSSFDGNETIFNLTKGGDPFFPGSPQSIIVSLNGTILEPVTQYGIDSSKIVFATAPTAGHSFFSITLGLPFGVFDNGSIEDGSLTGVKLSNPFNYDGGLLFLNSLTDKVGIRTENPTHDLDIHGDVRIVGILTVGTSSLVLDGSNNKIQVGTALTLSHSDGAIIGNSHLHSTGYDLKDNTRIRLGDSNDFQIYHTTSGTEHNRVESGSKQLRILSSSQIQLNTGAEHMAKFITDGAVELYHGMGSGTGAEKKFETSTTGATVTGKLVITGDLDVQGTTTTLDTTLTEVDKLEVGADNTTVGVAITQSGTGDALTIDDGTSRVLTVKDGGSVRIGDNASYSASNGGDNLVVGSLTGGNHGISIITGTGVQMGTLAFGDSTSGNPGAVSYRHTDNVMLFRAAGNTRMSIKGTGRVGIGSTNPKMQLHAYNSTPSDTGGILVSNVSYDSNQDKPYLIVGTKGWTGAATNWNTFGFQHKIKVNSSGVPKLTIDGANAGSEVELFTFKNGGLLGIGVTEPTGKLHLPDSGELRLGNDGDLKILHTGSLGVIGNVTGDLYIQANQDGDVGGDIYIRAKAGEDSIKCEDDGAVFLYNDGAPKFRTYNEGIQVLSSEGGNAAILIKADEADDNNDIYRIIAGDGTYLNFQNYATGSYVTNLRLTGDGNSAVELYYAGTKRLETTNTGVSITDNLNVAGITTSNSIKIKSTQPNLQFFDTNAAADNQKWNFYTNTSLKLVIQVTNDAGVGGGNLFFFTRSGNQISTFEAQKSGVTWLTVDNPNRKLTTRDLDVTNNLTTNGNLHISNLAPILKFTETDNSKVFNIVGDSSSLSVRMDGTGGSDIIQKWNSDGTHSFYNNVTFHNNIDVDGQTELDDLNVAGLTTITSALGTSTKPSLYLNTTASTSFIHSMQALTPNMTSGQQNIIVFGKARSTKNAAFIGYKYSGTSGSNNNLLTLNHWGANELVTVNGQGDTTIAGGLDVDGVSTFSADVNVGDGSADARILIKKADNNEADHIQFYNGTTRTGEIGSLDDTWLRINHETVKNIYTPRLIRADGGFFVDGQTKGIDGSGNFVNGTIAGASDYNTLLRADQGDTMNGVLTVGGDSVSANEGGEIILTLAPNSTLNGALVIDNYIDKLRIFEGSGGTARGAEISFGNITGLTGNEILSGGLTGDYTVTHLRSFNLPNGVVAISTSTQADIPLTVTNSGGFSSSTIIAKFVGDSDGIEIRNTAAGDYQIRNSAYNNGLSIFDGTGGVDINYNNGRKLTVQSNVKVNTELEFENDDEGVTTYAGGRFYKKSGGGIAIRQTSGNQTPIIENNAGTLQGTILHTGNASTELAQFLRSDANDIFTGTLTAGQDGKIAFPDNTTVPDNPTNEQHDYITFGAHGSISQVSGRGALMISSSDDALVLANGDVGRTFTNSHINVDPEDIFLLSDGQFIVKTDLQEGFGTEHTLTFSNAGVLTIGSDTVLTTGNIDDLDLPSGITITGASAQLNLKDSDTDADDFFVHVNSNKFFVLTDLDDDGTHSDDTTHHYPLVLDNATKKIASYGTPVLNGHQGFNPYDVVPAYSNTDYDSIRFNFTEMSMELSPPYGGTDTQIGMAFPAFRVNTNTGETFKLSVQIRSAASTTNGIYIRVYEYDAELPDGKTHVSNSAGNAVVQEDTRNATISPGFENIAGDTDWRTKTCTYTPTSTAVWASLIVLNWVGHGTTDLYVRDLKRELDLSSATTGTADIASQITLGNDSGGSTPRRLVFASADTGTVTIQADTSSGATYTPSTGTITAQNFSGSGSAISNVNAAKVVVSDESSDTTCHPLFATTNTGNAEVKVGSNLSFNSSTGALTATSFVGTRTGNQITDTGNRSTNGYLEMGRGGGGIALTINDGYGNANICFNHKSGVPEQNGASGRIEVNTDSTTANNAFMKLQLASAVTAGSAVNPTDVLNLMSSATAAPFRLGLMTTSPEATFHIQSNHNASDVPTMKLSEFRPSIHFEDVSTSATDWQILCDHNTISNGLQFLSGDSSTENKLSHLEYYMDHSGFHIGNSDGNRQRRLYLHAGTAASDVAQLFCSNGNLHIDAETGHHTYINHYEGNEVRLNYGGGGNSNLKLRTQSTGVEITGQLDLGGNMQFTAANPELEFNNGGPRFRVPAANTLTVHTGGTLGSTNEEVIRITSSGCEITGKLGINVEASEANLHIDASAGGPGILVSNAGSGEGDLAVDSDEQIQIGHWNKSTNTYSNRLNINAAGTTFRIIPAETRIEDGTAASPAINFNSDQDTGFFRPTTNAFSIATEGAEVFRLDDDKRLAIGDFSDGVVNDRNAMLYVKADSTRKGIAVRTAGSGTDVIELWSNKIDAGDGTDDDSVHLMAFRVGSGSGLKGSIFYNESTGQTQFSAGSSDRRLKENIVGINNAIDVIKQLKPCNFNFNKLYYNNNNIKHARAKTVSGFIADEVQTLIPQAVMGEKDAVYTEDDPDTGAKKGEIISQQMDMTKMIPHLTKALQEAIAKIETLEAEVTALKAKVG